MYFSKDSFMVVFAWKDKHEMDKHIPPFTPSLPEDAYTSDWPFAEEVRYCMFNNINHTHIFLDKSKEYLDTSLLKNNYLLFRSPSGKNVLEAKSLVKKALGSDTKLVIKDTVYNWPKHLKDKQYTNVNGRQVVFINYDNVNSVQLSYPTTFYKAELYEDNHERLWRRVENKQEQYSKFKELGGSVVSDNQTISDIVHGSSGVYRCFVSAFNVATISHMFREDQATPRHITDIAMDFVHDHKKFYPSTYVIDIYDIDGKTAAIAGLVDFETATRCKNNSVEKIYQFLVD